MKVLEDIVKKQKQGIAAGIYSCCSASEYVLRAAMRQAVKSGTPVLVEATANQVNQDGGYTGMNPKQFFKYAHSLAQEEGLSEEQLILGGDHLGPLTWSTLAENEAMKCAEELVAQYVRAGFTKIHIDTSMRLADDSRELRLSDEVIAARGARLVQAAEAAYRARSKENPGVEAPKYVIGSEVPVPGGIQEDEEGMTVTSPDDCIRTLELFREAFRQIGEEDAWHRVIAIVVQPGVEFGDHAIFEYNRELAADLTYAVKAYPGIVLEGHSTDYQTPERLREMVEDGIAFLKVGPALTFSMREGLFALESIEKELFPANRRSHVRDTLDEVMTTQPGYWEKYYHGTERELRNARAFSLSDRCRYYFHEPTVEQAVEQLLDNLKNGVIPGAMLSQYLPRQYDRIRRGRLENDGREILLDCIGERCREYLYAAGEKA